MIATARELYAAGLIDEAELDRHIEHALLRQAGRKHPVPDGWRPLEPCEHEWLDTTMLGHAERHEICRWCGDRQVRELGLVFSGL